MLEWPTILPARRFFIMASWMICGSLSFANCAKAREKVASEGISARVSHPHNLCSDEPRRMASRRAEVVGKFHKALATKALKRLSLLDGGQPLPVHSYLAMNFSGSHISHTATNSFCLPSNFPISSSMLGISQRCMLFHNPPMPEMTSIADSPLPTCPKALHQETIHTYYRTCKKMIYSNL